MRTHRIAVIPGDGIGREVMPAGLAVLRRAAEVVGQVRLEETELSWSCDHYLARGEMMPADGLAELANHDAIYLGAIGAPSVPDHIAIGGLILPIRQRFDLYVNLRPMRLMPGIESPVRVANERGFDILCVRENTEGEYVDVGGRFRLGSADEVALQTSVFTRRGIERIARYAFGQSRRRNHRLASATKSNVLKYSGGLWDDTLASIAREFPDVEYRSFYVDALAARFVASPETLDVVVASNLFGDILTDLGGAIQGSLGMAASANLNPERNGPAMFEPVHGSAPDIAGQGIANPMAATWAGALMLEYLGETDAASLVMRAIERVALEGPHTPDLGGVATTQDVAQALVAAVS